MPAAHRIEEEQIITNKTSNIMSDNETMNIMSDMTKALLAAQTISGILDDCKSDSNLSEIRLFCNGESIQALLEGDFNAKEVVRIGHEYGDDFPNIHAIGKETIQIVFLNNTHKELLLKNENITLKIEAKYNTQE
jgi:hypothetical protein